MATSLSKSKRKNHLSPPLVSAAVECGSVGRDLHIRNAGIELLKLAFLFFISSQIAVFFRKCCSYFIDVILENVSFHIRENIEIGSSGCICGFKRKLLVKKQNFRFI